MNKKTLVLTAALLLTAGFAFGVAEGIIWLIESGKTPAAATPEVASPAVKKAEALKSNGRSLASLPRPGKLADSDSPYSPAAREEFRQETTSGFSFFSSGEEGEGARDPDWWPESGNQDTAESGEEGEEEAKKAEDGGSTTGISGRSLASTSESAGSSGADSSTGTGTTTEEQYASLDVGAGGLSAQPTANGYTVSTSMGAKLNSVGSTSANGYKMKLGTQGQAE